MSLGPNIFEQEELVKGLPMDQLMQFAQQNPHPEIVPDYLLVSEVNRRLKMQERYANQQQQMEPSIKDQVVQGGIEAMGVMQQQQPQQPPQQAPQQMFAGGQVRRMYGGGDTGPVSLIDNGGMRIVMQGGIEYLQDENGNLHPLDGYSAPDVPALSSASFETPNPVEEARQHVSLSGEGYPDLAGETETETGGDGFLSDLWRNTKGGLNAFRNRVQGHNEFDTYGYEFPWEALSMSYRGPGSLLSKQPAQDESAAVGGIEDAAPDVYEVMVPPDNPSSNEDFTEQELLARLSEEVTVKEADHQEDLNTAVSALAEGEGDFSETPVAPNTGKSGNLPDNPDKAEQRASGNKALQGLDPWAQKYAERMELKGADMPDISDLLAERKHQAFWKGMADIGAATMAGKTAEGFAAANESIASGLAGINDIEQQYRLAEWEQDMADRTRGDEIAKNLATIEASGERVRSADTIERGRMARAKLAFVGKQVAEMLKSQFDMMSASEVAQYMKSEMTKMAGPEFLEEWGLFSMSDEAIKEWARQLKDTPLEQLMGEGSAGSAATEEPEPDFGW